MAPLAREGSGLPVMAVVVRPVAAVVVRMSVPKGPGWDHDAAREEQQRHHQGCGEPAVNQVGLPVKSLASFDEGAQPVLHEVSLQ